MGSEPEQVRVRMAKRERMLAAGVDPYPAIVRRTHSLAEVRSAHPELPANTCTGEVVAVVGRVMFLRDTGRLCFARLEEGGAGGAHLQVMLGEDRVGDDVLTAWKSDVDLGDLVEIVGEVITSRRGELSIFADEWRIASKALRPLPVSHKELGEETRVRQPYVDLLLRSAVGRTTRMRSAVVRSLRDSLHDRGYLEVETPMLRTRHGGAASRPFSTHSNAFDTDLYLRITSELFLKRCVVGGIERVFELNRVFRNEGSDSTHSPEFTMLEGYEAYGSYDTQAELVRELIQEAAQNACGSLCVTLADGSEYELSGEWDTLTLFGSLSHALGVEVGVDTDVRVLLGYAERLGLDTDPAGRRFKLVETLWEHLVGRTLTRPVFVSLFPRDVSPLTRTHPGRPGIVEKIDLYVRGFEVASAYTELTDPVVQRELLTEQSLRAAGGDPDAIELDVDFLRALEYGFPPTGGFGMGVDRLLMALTGLSMRDVVLFALAR